MMEVFLEVCALRTLKGAELSALDTKCKIAPAQHNPRCVGGRVGVLGPVMEAEDWAPSFLYDTIRSIFA